MNDKPPSMTGNFFVKAVIDVGTNSVKLLAAKFVNDSADSGMETLADMVVVSKLGESSDETGMLTREAMERTVAAIGKLCAEARRLGAGSISAVGTQALRRAPNAGEFLRFAEDACGVSIRVISGEEEAELSFAAVLSNTGNNSRGEIMVLDVGGGSSEVVMGRGGAVGYRRSIPVGALSLKKKFFISPDGVASDDVLYEAGCYVNSMFAETLAASGFNFENVSSCVGIGGTIATLAAVSAARSGEAPRVEGVTLGASEIDRQITMYAWADITARKKIPGLPAERVDTILPGACIVKSFMRVSGLDKIVVCDRGLRHGVMLREWPYPIMFSSAAIRSSIGG